MDIIKLSAMSTLCVDVFDSTDIIRPGGEPLNLVMNARKYPYMELSIIGAVGDDRYGEKILKSVEGTGIDISCVHKIENSVTASNVTYLTDDGDRYYKDNSWTGGAYQAFDKLYESDTKKIISSDVVFINFYSPLFKEVLDLRKSHSFKLAVDFDVMNDKTLFEGVSPYVDFFLISGQSGATDVLAELSEKYDCLYNITFAEKGSVTYHNGETYKANAVSVESVVDTTGAGDSYHAGFICSYMRDGDILKAMKEGAEAAAETIQHYGGF